jgi:hypothetical protein
VLEESPRHGCHAWPSPIAPVLDPLTEFVHERKWEELMRGERTLGILRAWNTVVARWPTTGEGARLDTGKAVVLPRLLERVVEDGILDGIAHERLPRPRPP